MNSQPSSYRSYLKSVLAEKMTENPSFSLRAAAQKLGLAPSFLSEVLQGKKHLSPEAGLRVASRLGLAQRDAEYFCLLIQLETSKDPDYRESIQRKIRAIRPEEKTFDLSVDVFKAISEWYHLAILELPQLTGGECTAKSASARLGISVTEAEVAIERLLRLGLLEDRAGRLAKTQSCLLVEARVPSATISKFHHQILSKAVSSLATHERDRRRGRSDVVPIDPKLLPEAEAILDRAASEIYELGDRSPKRTEVFALSLQFFSLTSKRESK